MGKSHFLVFCVQDESSSQSSILPRALRGKTIVDEALAEPKPPVVEWWDVPLLNGDEYSSGLNEQVITSTIRHPPILKPTAEAPAPPPMPLMLTEKEKKKVRRRRREEVQREKRDKIRLGLEPAPEPRSKIISKWH